MEKEKSFAVHERDLEEFLKNLEIYDELIQGEFECFNCKEKITLENLQSVFPLKGEIQICCTKLDCFQKALELKRRGKK